MGEWVPAALIAGFLIGLHLGCWLTKRNVFANADEPQRLLYREEFYKVFRLSRHSGGVHSDPGGHLDQSPPTEGASHDPDLP
jgi:hypothetical protein